MGAHDEQDEILYGKGENIINNIKTEVEELKDAYKKLKQQNDSHSRSITGLTTEKEDVRMRIRALLNKRQTAEGPDFDEYQITRRMSRQYEPIDHQRRKTSVAKKVSSSASPNVMSDLQGDSTPEEEPITALPASVTITVKAN